MSRGTTTRRGSLQVLSPFSSFPIVQHNSLGSWDVFLSLMDSLDCLHPTPLIVALQYPPVRNGRLPSYSTYKNFHPPVSRPRVAFYLHPFLLNSISILPVSHGRLDL